jgi:hypothetical protein
MDIKGFVGHAHGAAAKLDQRTVRIPQNMAMSKIGLTTVRTDR